MVDIDIKHLRWVSEIVADGSEKNPRWSRSETWRRYFSLLVILLIEKHCWSKGVGIAGLIGQVRGFNLDAFLSDYEQPGVAAPWAVGNDAWVSEKPGPAGGGTGLVPSGDRGSWNLVMAAEGIEPTLKVLYVPDYMPMEQRLNLTGTLHTQLSRLLPG